MDMKKLKQSMWDLLTEFPKQADAEVRCSIPSVGAWHGGRRDSWLNCRIGSANMESLHSEIHHSSEKKVNQVYKQTGHTEGDTHCSG